MTKIHGINLDVINRGTGKQIVLFHGFQQIDREARFLDLLSKNFEVIAPSLPGFGRSERPKDFETIYDVSNAASAFLDSLEPHKVTLIGFSFGGWVAAELAVQNHPKIERLILVDAVGIKVSDRETPDILDVFNTSPQNVKRAIWHDLANAPDLDAMSDEALIMRHRNWESLSLYGWHPYLHNPRLKYWLPRINVPTHVLWGEADGIVRPAYGRALSEMIPGARFSLIKQAGHQPEIEQPDVFVEHVSNALNG
jgi:pimeloyl-ACP methyl ester carboxylesterase